MAQGGLAENPGIRGQQYRFTVYDVTIAYLLASLMLQ